MGISEIIQHMFNHISAAVLGTTTGSKNTEVSRTDASPGLIELTPEREMHVTSEYCERIINTNKCHLLEEGHGISKGTITVSSHYVPSQVLISSSY